MALFSESMCLLSGPQTHTAAAKTLFAPPRTIFPLTKSQEGMWVEFQTDPSSTKYNLTVEWNLKENCTDGFAPTLIDVCKVIEKITKRHAVLRCTFAAIDGKPHMQEHVEDDVDPEIRIVHREDSVVSESAMKKILRRPFNLQGELPARWTILQDAQAYRVYIVSHHIAVDGQSMSLISREFAELLDDLDASLPPMSNFNSMHMIEKAWASSQTYLDNREVLLDQVRNKNNVPWPKQIAAQSTAGQDYRKIDSWAVLPKSELEIWSQLFKTSWFRVASALVGVLVVDKTRPQLGRDEVLSVGFGSRPKDMANSVGQFANALPVRVPLWQPLTPDSSDRSFKALVSAVGKNISAVKKAEMFPAVDVVRACRSSSIDYTPPRVAVTYSPKLAKSECRMFPVEGSWDLFFCFLEYEEDVKLGVIYNPAAFSDSVISQMKLKFESLIALSKMDQVKLDDMLDWLPVHPSLPASPMGEQNNPLRHLHHFFDAHALSSPSSVALHCGELGRSLTYGELYASTEKKSQILLEKGMSRESRVVLKLGQGFRLLEWTLAVLKSGAAFVYLDPDFGEVQMTAIIENCKPSLVIDDDMAQDLIISSSHSPTTCDIEQSKYATADQDLAYIVYTSGSTGAPKGVMIEHGNVAAFVRTSTKVFECGFGTRVLQLASCSFDASILEWTAALCTGATLCFSEYPKQLVGEYLADVIEQNDISFMQITPTALETLPMAREYTTLRQISIGGEAPSREIFARWHARANLVNAYGPTEAAIAVSFMKISRTDDLTDVISAGFPTKETFIHICSEDFGSVLQAQSQGEICISGPQIARGYCENPETTAKNFCFNANGVRMYRTGDRGVLAEDGSLTILGRIDRDLKIRGFRIAPEEVEKAIYDAEVGVSEASVQPSEDGLGMVAFTAPETVDKTRLQYALKKLLPPYKLPSRFRAVSSLPKSVAGKIDHKAVRSLPKQVNISEESDASDGRARSITSTQCHEDSEEEVAHIWQDVLGLDAPPPSEVNFFDIGGHSLLVPKLHARLRVAFPKGSLRLVDLFHQSTIKHQAALVGADKSKRALKGIRKKTRSCASSRATVQGDAEPEIAAIWRDVLQLDAAPSSIVNFFDIGGHSLLVPKLHARLRTSFPSKAIRVVDLFHQSTIKQQAALLGGERRRKATNNLSRYSSVSSLQSALPSTGSVGSEFLEEMPDVAITGLAGRFPGAKNADEFYDNLMNGRSGISESQQVKPTLPGNMWVSKAGVLQDVEEFDNEFWHLSKEEATEMDPQQRLFLDVAYEALTDAGLDIHTMDGSRTGLFIGAANHSYHLYTDSVAVDPFQRENRGFIAPSISARTAYHLNISGPNVTIQTNCASSTVALSQAYDAIRLGRCDAAVVGGVSVQLFDEGYVTQEGQIFSPRGQCTPFDSRADGTVPADAVTCVVLKRYTDAVCNHEAVYARILGTAIGSDGSLEKAGYQVPSPRGQAEVIKAAWKVARMTPSNLRYAEIHGSGTPIGDALELEGLSLAVREAGGSGAPFTVGSTKGNIGNTQHSSGLVSLIKLCKSMQHRTVPAIPGLKESNEMISKSLPLNLARKPTHLSLDDVLCVSASGWGGVNSHVILGFPESHIQKTSTTVVPLGTFSRKTLAAPRQHEATAATVFARLAADALGCEIDVNSNLKEYGLDSKSYVSLMRTASCELRGPAIGVSGLLLPSCTPKALAALYDDQLRSQPAAQVVANVLSYGTDATIIVCPGSGGTFAGATRLLEQMPSNATVVTLEHQGEDPSSEHVEMYTEAAVPYLNSPKLVLVAASLSGKYSPVLLHKLAEKGGLFDVGLVVLDSPSTYPDAGCRDFLAQAGATVTYIGASKGIYQSDCKVKSSWETMFPNVSFHELECDHSGVWGMASEKTARIIGEVVNG